MAETPPSEERTDAAAHAEVSDWVARFAALARPGCRVLDLACGSGRHSRFFAARGHPVLAVDRADPALIATHNRSGGEIIPLQTDLERSDGAIAPEIAGGGFGVIVVTNYLHRPLLPRLPTLLAPDGFLIYETFALGNARFGRPRNPDFLLRPGELAAVFADLHIVAYEHGRIERSGGPAIVQRICATTPPTDLDDAPALACPVMATPAP